MNQKISDVPKLQYLSTLHGMLAFRTVGLIDKKYQHHTRLKMPQLLEHKFTNQVMNHIEFWDDNNAEHHEIKRKIKYNPEAREILQAFYTDKEHEHKMNSIKDIVLEDALQIEKQEGKQAIYYTSFNFMHSGNIEGENRYLCSFLIGGLKYKQHPLKKRCV